MPGIVDTRETSTPLEDAMPGMKGGPHGSSIKNPTVYEALRRKGYSKSKSAAISNAKRGGRRRGKR